MRDSAFSAELVPKPASKRHYHKREKINLENVTLQIMAETNG